MFSSDGGGELSSNVKAGKDAIPFPSPTSSSAIADLQNTPPTPRWSSANRPPGARKPFYAQSSSQPFSRSAAKRQSVMALGSIKHLQHQFLKAGLSSVTLASPSLSEEPESLQDDDSTESASRKASKSATVNLRLSRLMQHAAVSEEDLPPTPVAPEVDTRMPWEKNGELPGRKVKSEGQLRKEVCDALEDVCNLWGLVVPLSTVSPASPNARSQSPCLSSSTSGTASSRSNTPNPVSDLILELLQTTTASIRTVQSYVVALPEDAAAEKARSELRVASLGVLGGLREIETRYRIPNDHNSSRRDSSSASEPPLEESSTLEEPSSDRTPSRLSSFSDEGAEYLPLSLASLAPETELVRGYTNAVDLVLCRERERKKKALNLGHRRTRAVESVQEVLASASNREGESVAQEGEKESGPSSHQGSSSSDEERPKSVEEPLGELERCHDLIATHLHSASLPPALPEIAFLAHLSDGQTLLLGYNAVVAASDKAFGFVTPERIHNPSVKSDGAIGGTFRKIENLRLWAGALRFRYHLTVEGFDAKVVARKEAGWESMLTGALVAWLNAVDKEKREDWEASGP